MCYLATFGMSICYYLDCLCIGSWDRLNDEMITCLNIAYLVDVSKDGPMVDLW